MKNHDNLNDHPDYLRLPLSARGFTNGSGGLTIAGIPLRTLIDRFGTPFYLFREDGLRDAIRRARATAAALFRDCRLFYPVKTNGRRRVLEIVLEEGLGAEVISLDELNLVLAMGFAPGAIVFNGPGKTDTGLRRAVRAGVHINVESVGEAEVLCRIAEEEDSPVSAGLRINSDVFQRRERGDMGMVGACWFGLEPGEEEFEAVLRRFRRTSLVRFHTLSAHIGTGVIESAPYRLLARSMSAIRDALNRQGFIIDTLDLGGGFSIAAEVRLPERTLDTFALPAPGTIPAPETIATFADCCHAIASQLPSTAPSIILEPGRLLVSGVFHLVSNVVRLKEHRGTTFVILDAGRIQNALFAGRGYHDIIHVNRPVDKAAREYTVVGPLCAGFDVYARSRRLPELREGDALLLGEVGAYNLSAQSGWSFVPAPVVAVSGTDVRHLGSDRPW
ncbi:hypothetical protein JW905_16415 [bacterium]|nr:hypothetical protein [candidate division CSSED10-310 bacterium]